MKKSKDSATELSNWGNSLLNQLPAITRNRRKRDAGKKRRNHGKEEIESFLHDSVVNKANPE